MAESCWRMAAPPSVAMFAHAVNLRSTRNSARCALGGKSVRLPARKSNPHPPSRYFSVGGDFNFTTPFAKTLLGRGALRTKLLIPLYMSITTIATLHGLVVTSLLNDKYNSRLVSSEAGSSKYDDPVRENNRWQATRDLLPAGWRTGGLQGDSNQPPALGGGKGMKVALLGAGGALGRTLALLLRQSGQADELALYDLRSVRNLQHDLSRVDARGVVNAFSRPSDLPLALQGARMVVVAAGTRPRRRDTLESHFARNAPVVSEMSEAIAKHCPTAIVTMVTTPVSACTALAANTLLMSGASERSVARRLMGVTAKDSWRAASLLGALLAQPALATRVPVVGGSGGRLAVPLFSQASTRRPLSEGDRRGLMAEMQECVVSVAESEGPVRSLCAAVAVCRFLEAVLRAARGETRIVECAMVHSESAFGVDIMAEPVELGTDGVQRTLGLGKLSMHEERLLARALREHQRELQMVKRMSPPRFPGAEEFGAELPSFPPSLTPPEQRSAPPPPLPDVPEFDAPFTGQPPPLPELPILPDFEDTHRSIKETSLPAKIDEHGEKYQSQVMARAERVLREVRRAARRRMLLRAQDRDILMPPTGTTPAPALDKEDDYRQEVEALKAKETVEGKEMGKGKGKEKGKEMDKKQEGESCQVCGGLPGQGDTCVTCGTKRPEASKED